VLLPPHPLLRWAGAIVRHCGLKPDRRTHYHDTLWDDACAVALSHLWGPLPRHIQRMEAIQAVREYVRKERQWRNKIAPLLEV
jgi:hypothetical protein